MARPSKLDDLRAKRIVDALRDGHSFAAAARAGGINESTLHDWRNRGADGEPEFSAFSKRVDEASREAENRAVQVLKTAMCGFTADPKLATDTAWRWLRARRPLEWIEPKTLTEPEAAQAESGGNDLAVAESVVAALKSRKVG